MIPSKAFKALQASECSELLDPMISLELPNVIVPFDLVQASLVVV